MTMLVDHPRNQSPLFDDAGLRQWTEDLTAEQVKDILAKVPQDCRSAIREIKTAIEANNMPTARRIAHRVKGMASNLGATRLAEAARAIELGPEAAAEHAGRLRHLGIVVDETSDAIAGLCNAL